MSALVDLFQSFLKLGGGFGRVRIRILLDHLGERRRGCLDVSERRLGRRHGDHGIGHARMLRVAADERILNVDRALVLLKGEEAGSAPVDGVGRVGGLGPLGAESAECGGGLLVVARLEKLAEP